MASLEELIAAKNQNDAAMEPQSVPASDAPAPAVAGPEGTPVPAPSGGLVRPGPVSTSAEASPQPDLRALMAAKKENDAAIANPTPPPAEVNAPALQNWSRGFYRETARLLGLPGSAMNSLFQTMGLPGMGKMPHDIGQPTQEMVAKLMDAAGLRTDPDKDAMATKIGEATVDNMLFLGGAMAAAPKMAAKAGYSTWDYLSRTIGEGLQNRPYMAILMELMGATPGSVIGGEKAGPLGAFAGGMAGGGAFSAAAGASKKVVGTVSKVLDALSGQKNLPKGMSSFAPGSNIEERISGITGKPERTGPPIKGSTLPRDADALRDVTSEPTQARSFSENQVEGIRLEMEEAVVSAVNSVPNPGEVADGWPTAVRKALEGASKVGKRIEDMVWSRTPVKERMSPSGVLNDLDEFEARVNDPSSLYHKQEIPQQAIDRIRSWGVRGRDPETGQVQPHTLTVAKVLAEARQIRNDLVAEQMKRGASRQEVALNNELRTILFKGIDDAFPHDVSIQQAREVSVMYHDLFDRSALWEILAKGPQGGAKTHPAQTLEALFNAYSGKSGEGLGLKDVLTMVSKLSGIMAPPGRLPGTVSARLTAAPGPKGGRAYVEPALGPQRTMAEDALASQKGGPQMPDEWGQGFHPAAEPQGYPGPRTAAEAVGGQEALSNTTKTIEDAIRADFHRIAQNTSNDPKAVARWLRDNRGDIAPSAKVLAEMDHVSAQISAQLQRAETLEKSALARFAQRDPQRAVADVWNSKDPSKAATELVKEFQGNEQALRGFRAGMVDNFLNKGKWDPGRLNDLWKDPMTNRLMKAALSPEEYLRMGRLIDVAQRLDRGDPQSFIQQQKGKITILLRVLGAKFGTFLSHFGGSGNIQTPAIFSQGFRKWGSNLIYGPEAKTLFRDAVFNPASERLMLSKEPTSSREGAETLRTMKRVLGQMTGAKEFADRKAPTLYHYVRKHLPGASPHDVMSGGEAHNDTPQTHWATRPEAQRFEGMAIDPRGEEQYDRLTRDIENRNKQLFMDRLGAEPSGNIEDRRMDKGLGSRGKGYEDLTPPNPGTGYRALVNSMKEGYGVKGSFGVDTNVRTTGKLQAAAGKGSWRVPFNPDVDVGAILDKKLKETGESPFKQPPSDREVTARKVSDDVPYFGPDAARRPKPNPLRNSRP